MTSLNSVTPSNSEIPDLSIAVRTLITGGFILESAHRNPGYAILSMMRRDEFGQIHHYCFVIAEDLLSTTQIEAARIAATHEHAILVLVGPVSTKDTSIPWQRFMNIFGGPVLDMTPLEPEFPDRLVQLGHNILPPGLHGEPSDLYELFVRAALEFVLGMRVIRYGQDRLFEARPDGISLPDHGFTALFDAKAYKDGYEVTTTTLRQLQEYVVDFSKRYNAYLPRLNTFILISSTFQQKDDALETKSRDLLASCGVPITFVTSNVLAQVIRIFIENPAARRSVNWSRIFADPILDIGRVQTELRTVLRDGIIPSHLGASNGNIH
jgi:hypothetical protein